MFLPLAVAVHFLLTKAGHSRLAVAGLVSLSLAFCGWRGLTDAEILMGSICINFLIALLLHRQAGQPGPKQTFVLALGITVNLSLLGYFKYSAFVVENVNALLHTTYPVLTTYLPIGISFLTFQQIAYLTDVYRGQVKTFNFLDYCFVCSFFPKFLAGPIVRHAEVVPQIAESMRMLSREALAAGATRFTIGLFKKVVLADTLAGYATPLFAADTIARDPGMVEAWSKPGAAFLRIRSSCTSTSPGTPIWPSGLRNCSGSLYPRTSIPPTKPRASPIFGSDGT